MIRRFVPLLYALAGCSQSLPPLPQGQQAYTIIPPATGRSVAQEYRIGPLDTLAVSVFGEPDLSVKDMPVDASGNILLPLIGRTAVAGKTAEQIGRELEISLGRQYLVSPSVSVIVQQSARQRITVEGAVNEPGIYDIRGSSSLIDALALAKGPLRTARMNEVLVYRYVDGRRMGAIFDISRIRRGEAADPELIGGDTVVIGSSAIKSAWRDALTAAPFLGFFRVF